MSTPINPDLASGIVPTHTTQPDIVEPVIVESIPSALKVMPTHVFQRAATLKPFTLGHGPVVISRTRSHTLRTEVPRPSDTNGERDESIDWAAAAVQKPAPPQPVTGTVLAPTAEVTPWTGPMAWLPPTSTVQDGAKSTLVTIARS
ncbi:hypothetical protein E8E13_006917 [Curvularia kusanoi]|uniref:Uncharacterized protein n=1 Tax=Curvularia kusanoi TaxID=90978 RepID=A0A9P4TFP9_CURKU|nr:hypothetical protein E8E13_006917 [Curvularia kusanoi]